jgi:hypothetical protein
MQKTSPHAQITNLERESEHFVNFKRKDEA